MQRRIYGGASENDIARRWREALERASSARAVLLGVPSDVGAGFLRGSNLGPQAIRARILEEDPGFFARAADKGLLDLGDVFVVPQLLHDDMLSPPQAAASRAALYPGLTEVERARLPVSPLSIAERVLALLFEANPRAGLLLLGGDHSCALPAVRSLLAVRPGLAVVQVDAHTDLLPERLGIRYCFGTWSYHANDLLGRGGRLIQVGIRASRHGRDHWESSLGVRQLWAEEVRADPSGAEDLVLDLVRRSGARTVYFSNDIDGTDPALASATGTPEPGGLSADFVASLIRRLGGEISLAGGDVVEVAPSLAARDGEPDKTLAVAARYLRETAEALLGAPV